MPAEPRVQASIIVPTHARPASLQRLLLSLEVLDNPPKEVIIVADRDDFRTRTVLDHWTRDTHPFSAKEVIQEEGLGPGAARNRGARLATEHALAFIDDDCVASPAWLERIVSKLDSNERVVGAGGRVAPLRDDVVSKYYNHYGILEPPNSLEYLVSANCAYLRGPLLDVGGFQEDIKKPGGEDVGLSFRLAQTGWKFEFVQDAIVYHDFRSSIPNFIATFRNYGMGVHKAMRTRPFSRDRETSDAFNAGGYGYGSLAPSRTGLVELMQEGWSVYQSSRLEYGFSTASAFSCLRMLQRLSYYHGWLSSS